MWLRLALLALLAASVAPMTARADDISLAEYRRLSEKLASLAAKNAWSGVERTYQEMLTTGEPLTFDDYLYGANAARGLGDMTSAHDRLEACNKIREDRQVIDWLYDIDMNYGMVSLMADPGAVELVAKEMPFDPTAASAVVFAQQRIGETGIFEGYLPGGEYVFGQMVVRVRPKVSSATIDIRSDEGARGAAKATKATKKKGKKK